MGTKGYITIGLSNSDFPQNKQVGQTEKSYGYKADGKIFHGKKNGDNYGSKFTANSTVGCGVIFATQEIFFVVDGNFHGVAFKNVDTANLYPTISLHSPNEEVRVNFGQDPFKFDIDSMIIVLYPHSY